MCDRKLEDVLRSLRAGDRAVTTALVLALFNPSVVAISTRGSADSLNTLLIIWLLQLLIQGMALQVLLFLVYPQNVFWDIAREPGKLLCVLLHVINLRVMGRATAWSSCCIWCCRTLANLPHHLQHPFACVPPPRYGQAKSCKRCTGTYACHPATR